MFNEQRVYSLIDKFYEAALDNRLWNGAIQEMINLTGFDNGSLCVMDKSRQRFISGQMINWPRGPDMSCYIERTYAYDPKFLYWTAHSDTRIFYDYLHNEENEIDHDPFYQNIMQDQGGVRYHITGLSHPVPGYSVALGLYRRSKFGHVQKDDIELFDFMFRHFERAMQISFRLEHSAATTNALLEILERQPLGIVLIDTQCRIVFANTAARKFSGALILNGHSPSLRKRDENDRLHKLMAGAVSFSNGKNFSNGGIMVASQQNTDHPLAITVAPLSTNDEQINTGYNPAGILLISDPERERPLPEEYLHTVYKLTRAEAKLAVQLASGSSLDEAAEQLFVSKNTVRSQLKSVFHKTDTHRQTELVSLLLRSAVNYPREHLQE